MSNITSCDSGSISISRDAVKQHHHHQSEILIGNFHSPNSHDSSSLTNNSNASNNNNPNSQPPLKKKRSLPGNPDPSAEVIALSPNTLVAKNRFMCEICNKGFQRDQNLQLHRRGHNLPWKLKQRTTTDVRKRVYVCPEASCLHHNPARALGDLTGIKKHFSRKHGEKKWKCEKCSKKYAVQSDLKAHSRICGSKEYKCDCGTIFSRRDSFITHRAFCDALAEENFNKVNEGTPPQLLLSKMQQRGNSNMFQGQPNLPVPSLPTTLINNSKHPSPLPREHIPSLSPNISSSNSPSSLQLSPSSLNNNNNMMFNDNGPHYLAAGLPPHMSAIALLQKAAQMGVSNINNNNNNNITSMPLPATSSSFGSVPTSNGIMEQQYYVHNINNAQHDMFLSHEYNFNNMNGIDGMNGVDVFNAILDQSKAFSKIIEQNSSRNNTINVGSSCPLNIGIRSSSKGSDNEGVMTLDLLGIGAGGGRGGGAHGYFCNPLN